MKRLFDENTEHYVCTAIINLDDISYVKHTKEAAEQFAQELVGREVSAQDGSYSGEVAEAILDFDKSIINIIVDVKHT